MISPVEVDARIDTLNKLTFQAAYLIEDQGWVQDQMIGDAGELCIISAGHTAAQVLDTPGMSHVLREVLDHLGYGEKWNDVKGRNKSEVIGLLSRVKITEANLEATFGPGWKLVCYLAESFARYSHDEMNDWMDSRDEYEDYAMLRHLDDQESPDQREVRARGAVCAAASERALEFNIKPQGPSAALMTSKVIRPTLRS